MVYQVRNSKTMNFVFLNPVLNFIVILSYIAVPVSESVTLIGEVSDVGSVYNEGLSLEH